MDWQAHIILANLEKPTINHSRMEVRILKVISYLILSWLYRTDAKSKIIAATRKMILDGLAEEGTGYCDKTIYNNLRNLIQGGYVKNGMPVGNTYTYYITSKGMNWLKEMEEEETEE